MTAFTKQKLLNMLEVYQSFCCNGIKITSPVHNAAPELARQLLTTMQREAELRAEVERLKEDASAARRVAVDCGEEVTALETEKEWLEDEVERLREALMKIALQPVDGVTYGSTFHDVGAIVLFAEKVLADHPSQEHAKLYTAKQSMIPSLGNCDGDPHGKYGSLSAEIAGGWVKLRNSEGKLVFECNNTFFIEHFQERDND